MNKLNVTPFSCEQINNFSEIEEINAFILGNSDFSLRYVNNFTIEEIKSIKTSKKVYVDMNKILHNREISKATEFLNEVKDYIDGVIFSDMAVYQIVKNNNLNLEMMYSTETTITNSYFTKFAKKLGINCIDLAREINLAEASEINESKESEVCFYIHGHIYMYQSLRKLITNYHEYNDVEFSNGNYKLYDDERDLYYPIVENEQGTHVMSGSDLSTLGFIKRITDVGFDYLKIDGFLYTESDYEFLVNLYVKAINDLENNYQSELESVINKKFSPGFLFKKTIY